MNISRAIGENIRVFREIKGYSQEYLASQLDMTQSGYAKLESGQNTIKIDKLQKIAELLDTDIANLLQTKDCQVNVFNNANVQSGTSMIENIYMDNKSLTDDLINSLKEEIAYLRKTLDELRKSED